MGLLSNLFGGARPVAKPTQKARFSLSPDWVPDVPMERVIVHWTAGSYTASSHDKNAYHFLVEGNLNVVRGKHSVADNVTIGNKSSDFYAAHTRGLNTKSIGLSICAMADAKESSFNAGRYPLTEQQWQRAAEVVAFLCRRYNIEVTNRTVLTHAEVQPNLGVTQNGKWDISRLPFNLSLKGPKACGDDFRRRVLEALK